MPIKKEINLDDILNKQNGRKYVKYKKMTMCYLNLDLFKMSVKAG
jgi:hypothetical protein